MKKTMVVVGAFAVLAAGWFLASPLFIDEVIDEDFVTRVSAMTESERKAMMPQIMQVAADAPDRASNEIMPEKAPVLVAKGGFSPCQSFTHRLNPAPRR